MARMWQAPAVACDRDLTWNARQILATRVAEVYAHAAALTDPLDAKGHHDLRISIKRLRYSLEFFAVCYDAAEVAEILLALSTMQEHLGQLHDADVFVPEMQRVLEGLASARALAVHEAAAAPRGAPRSFEEFAAALERPEERDAKPGILGVINRMRCQRRESYAAASALWATLEADGFRSRLERLGAPAESPE